MIHIPPVNSRKVFKQLRTAIIPVRNVKNEKNSEKPWVENPHWWNFEKCAEKLLEHTDIDGAIWDLRGQVFETLKKMGKFPENSAGSEHQASVDRIIVRLLEGV